MSAISVCSVVLSFTLAAWSARYTSSSASLRLELRLFLGALDEHAPVGFLLHPRRDAFDDLVVVVHLVLRASRR